MAGLVAGNPDDYFKARPCNKNTSPAGSVWRTAYFEGTLMVQENSITVAITAVTTKATKNNREIL